MIESLIREIHASGFHMSGKEKLASAMKYRNEQVNMGLPGLGEFDIFRTEEGQIRRAKQALRKKDSI